MSAFPLLVPDDVMADLKYLNAQESGAYLLLLMVAQRLARRTLPDDDTKLARWARVEPSTWRRIKPVVMAFWIMADGGWMHKRPNKARGLVTAEPGRAGEAVTDAQRAGAAKPADLRALARSHGAGAIAHLAAILNDPTAPLRARLTAAQTLLDRGFAKPTQEADREASVVRPKITRIIVTPGERDPVTGALLSEPTERPYVAPSVSKSG